MNWPKWLTPPGKFWRFLRGKRGKVISLFESLLPHLRTEFAGWLRAVTAEHIPDHLDANTLDAIVNRLADTLVDAALDQLAYLKARIPT